MGIAVLTVGSFFCVSSWGSPADLPFSHWSYEAIERLAVIGLCEGLGLGMRPITRDWAAARVAEALKTVEERDLGISPEMASQIEEDLLRLSEEFAEELKRLGASNSEEEGTRRVGSPFRWKAFRFQTGFVSEKIVTGLKRDNGSSLLENSQGFRLRDGFNGRWHLPSWLSLEDWLAVTLDPSLRVQKEDSGADLDFEEASVKLAYRNLELKGGELNFWWGPGYHGELLLTNNTRPLRAFSLRSREAFQLPWKLKHLGRWHAQLIGVRLEEKRIIKNDLITGIRLEWSLVHRLVIGASQTSLFGGEGEGQGVADFFRALDPSLGGSETDRTDRLFGADARLFLPELIRWSKIGTGFELYGGFFGEDTDSFYIPRFTSNLGGVLLTDFFSVPGLDFRFEGAKTDGVAYEHFAHASGYRFKNEFIGHPIGADADDSFFRLTKQFSFQERRLVAGAQFDRERQGVSGSLLSFGQTALIKNEFQIDLRHEVSDHLEVTVAYQFEDIGPFRGSSGVDARNHLVMVGTSFRF